MSVTAATDAAPRATPVAPEPRPGWRSRGSGAVGIAVGVVVLALVAALVSGSVRQQLALSLTRVDPTYAEMYFAGGAGTALACRQVAAGRPVQFSVVLHGAGHPVDYRVQLRPQRGVRAVRTVTGRASGAPGQVLTQRVRIGLPASLRGAAYDVRVNLAGTRQLLVAHCAGVRR